MSSIIDNEDEVEAPSTSTSGHDSLIMDKMDRDVIQQDDPSDPKDELQELDHNPACPDNKGISCALSDELLSIDTVRLFHSDADRISIAKLDPHNETRNCMTRTTTFTYRYNNLFITQTDRRVSVEGSLAVYKNRDNVYPLRFAELPEVIEELSDLIGLNVRGFSVTRMDVAANLTVSCPPSRYFSLLAGLTRHRREVVKSTLYFKSGSTTLMFYDEVAQTKAKLRKMDPAEWEQTMSLLPPYLLRYELQVKKVSKVLRRQVLASELADPEIVGALVEQYHTRYESIVKNPTSPVPLTGQKTPKAYFDYFAANGVQALGGYDRVDKDLSEDTRAGFISPNQASRVRRKTKKILATTPTPLKSEFLRELDTKIQSVCLRTLDQSSDLLLQSRRAHDPRPSRSDGGPVPRSLMHIDKSAHHLADLEVAL